MTRPLRVAVVGSGPAGIYASDILIKSGQDVAIDLYEKMPAPFGLIRYGVAPDHPRIKGIIKSLHKVLDQPQIKLLGNVEIGKDVTVEELRDYYDAIIFATGATGDRDLNIPGIDLEGSRGAAEFVGFYDGNPNFQREWDLTAPHVAVIGVGNVALDVARILAKTADELHVTEIPDNVYEGLGANAADEVHIFGRRGPGNAKFTPLELKELDHSPTIEVIVDPEDIIYDEAAEQARRDSKTQDLVCQTLEQYALREPKNAPHKLFIHFFEAPVEIVDDGTGKVAKLKTERQEYDGKGGIRGTGKITEWDVQAVYRAVGYRSDEVKGVPFDHRSAVIPNDGGHVIDSATRDRVPGLYTTGWIKRGPVG
ncbi:FAD-dependent oxidoreductase, partial [uncultured Corynebacterium sp.]|uniref:FAD-dependent oxidoreductase n=1 Tax=uncultured Corynebacterium sp. TaxID=159447 RepID=UPI00261AA254